MDDSVIGGGMGGSGAADSTDHSTHENPATDTGPTGLAGASASDSGPTGLAGAPAMQPAVSSAASQALPLSESCSSTAIAAVSDLRLEFEGYSSLSDLEDFEGPALVERSDASVLTLYFDAPTSADQARVTSAFAAGRIRRCFPLARRFGLQQRPRITHIPPT